MGFKFPFSELSKVQGGSISMLPSATNRSKPNNYLFYNRIPKCGSSTAMKYMRSLSFKLKYHWIGMKLYLFNLRIYFVNQKSLPDSKDYQHYQRSPKNQEKIVKYLKNLPDEFWAYEQHLFFIDFNMFNVSLEDQPNV